MARARLLKPGFFTNEDLCELPPLARILFAGLWTVADRNGRLEDRPKRIKTEVLPYDDADVDGLLDTLTSFGFITRYQVDGARYIEVSAFTKHQHIHPKEPRSDLPAPVRDIPEVIREKPGEFRSDPSEAEAGSSEAEAEADRVAHTPAREPIALFPAEPEDIARPEDPVCRELDRAGIPLTYVIRDDLDDYQRRGVPDSLIVAAIRDHPDKPWKYLVQVIETRIRKPQETPNARRGIARIGRATPTAENPGGYSAGHLELLRAVGALSG